MILVKVLKENKYIEEYYNSFEEAMTYVSNLNEEKDLDYWTARVYVDGILFFNGNKFTANPKTDLLPANFTFKNEKNDEIKLIIKSSKDNGVIIDAWINDKKIANDTKAIPSFYDKYRERAYLKFTNIINGRTTMMCICDLKKEDENETAEFIKNNRKISNLLFELGKCNNLLFPFSMYHPTVRALK